MRENTIHKLETCIPIYIHGASEPTLTVKSGDVVVATALDAYGFNEKMEPKEQRRFANPLVGPIYVEEARSGDTLAVNIQKIKLNRNYARSGQRGHFACLTGEVPGKQLLLNEPIPESWFDWHLNLERNIGTLELKESKLKRIEVPLHPFLGCIGVAPPFGRIETSEVPGEYAGNMDCVETKEGTTLYLPVWVRGAYLAFGDVHAAQGDGEICGSALETTAEVTVKLEMIKGKSIEWPRLEDDRYIMTAGNGRPLMDCVRIAQIELVKWLVDDYGFEKWEAFQVVSQVMTMRVGNIVSSNYTVIAKFPKKYLAEPA